MPRRYTLYQIDSFTTEKFSGNPAGVITDADGLSETEMRAIARELNNSETAFILSPGSEDGDCDVHIRYFTPTREVPICGHATIAAHYARAVENNLGSMRVVARTGAGILPVDIVREGDECTIIMTQGKPGFEGRITGAPLKALLKALGIGEHDLRDDCPVEIASTGHSKVMIGITDEKLLHSLHPDMPALSALSREIGCNGYYVFTLDQNALPASGAQGRGLASLSPAVPLVHGRMFAPAIGITEDPVTGNANGPLGAYLVHHGLAGHDGALFEFLAVQGEAINRPGTIRVRVSVADNEPDTVQIIGKAVIVFTAQLTLD